jgi:DMSO reductase anchor subunit
MHPAYSVILFTTASGAGYGLLALLGLTGISHGQASSLGFGLTAALLALGLVTGGLLSSTFHLGHPERAWRAFSQWRSSWLSREAVLALVAYVPAVLFGLVWSGLMRAPSLIGPLATLTIIFSILTVSATAMIYRSLPTIAAWAQPLTVPVYLAFALATGSSLLAMLTVAFDRFPAFLAGLTAIAISLAAILKLLYWRAIDRTPATHTIGSATGLGRFGSVRQWEVPHTSVNFVQKEMGYAVARRHARKLRHFVLLLLLAAVILSLLAVKAPSLVFLGGPAALVATLIERWLFFAEARHVAMLYYGVAPA